MDEWQEYARKLDALPPDEQATETAKLSPGQRRALEEARVADASFPPAPPIRKRKVWPWVVACGCLPLGIVAVLFAISVIGRFVTPPTVVPTKEVYNRVVDPKKVLESTDISILKEQIVNIQASGQVVTWHIENASGPDGQRFTCNGEGCACTFKEGRFGQLIGRIGESGKVFGVGSSYAARAEENGILFLGVNDCNDWSNNTGSYDVTVEIANNPGPR
jgi:hypothetical protein